MVEINMNLEKAKKEIYKENYRKAKKKKKRIERIAKIAILKEQMSLPGDIEEILEAYDDIEL